MARAAKIRLLALAAIGAALIAVGMFGLSERFRGVGYYFPVWIPASVTMSDLYDRSFELTNVADGVPIVMAAIGRSPSSIGRRWQSLRGDLPPSLQQWLPQYQEWASRPAMDWLTARGGEPEVAQAVARRWATWPELTKGIWFGSQPVQTITNRTEYWSALRATAQRTNSDLRVAAAYFLAAYRPLLPDNAEPIAAILVSCLADEPIETPQEWLILELASHSHVPPRIIDALLQWNRGTNQIRACLAGLALTRLDPKQFPPEQILEPSLRALLNQPGSSTSRLRDWLGRNEFLEISGSSWGLDFWQNYLVEASRIPRERWDSAAALLFALNVIENLGPSAARSATAVMPLMSDHQPNIASAAARTFASIAPPSTELASSMVIHLTNRVTVAPLLLWLTAIGTNALPARAAVEKIADGTTRYSRSIWTARPQLSGELVRRFAVLPLGPAAVSSNSSPISSNRSNPLETRSRADEILVEADEACPARLATVWPGFDDGKGPRLRYPGVHTSRRSYVQGLLIRQPETSLAELARRCLTNMNQPPASLPAVLELPINTGALPSSLRSSSGRFLLSY